MGTAGVGDSSLGWDQTAVRTRARHRTFMLPDVLSDRLDALVDHLDRNAVHATRADVVGALLLATEPDAEHLEVLLRRYRMASVEDVHLGARQGDRYELHPANPGPRPRT